MSALRTNKFLVYLIFLGLFLSGFSLCIHPGFIKNIPIHNKYPNLLKHGIDHLIQHHMHFSDSVGRSIFEQQIVFIIFFLGITLFFLLLLKRHIKWFMAMAGILLIFSTLFIEGFWSADWICLFSISVFSLYSGLHFIKKRSLSAAVIFSLISLLQSTVHPFALGFPLLFTMIYFSLLLHNIRWFRYTLSLLLYFTILAIGLIVLYL